MADVFISYKAEDFDQANWVRTTLETNGVSCWMAPMSIPGGSSYAEEIPQAIRTASVFVLILSERCQLSKWVPRELDQAINNGKTILPFMLEDCPLKDDFNFYLSNVQRYAAYENKAAAMEKMIREIRSLLGISDPPDGAPEKSGENSPAPDGAGEAASSGSLSPGAAAAAPPDREEGKQKPGRPEKKAGESKPAGKANGKKAAGKAKDEKPAGKAKGKKKPNAKTALGAAAAALAAVVLIAVIAVMGNTVRIAGEKFRRSASYVSLKEKTVSAEDVANLSRFRSLNSLHLTDCELPEGDLNGIFSAVKSHLELVNCGVSDRQLSTVDFSALSLRALYLDGNPAVTDLSALAPLGDKLTELSFDGCSVSDISFLSDFTKLTKLNAAGNGIASLDALTGCTALASVDVSGNLLSDLSGLEQCVYLITVSAQGNQIGNLDGLSNATLLSDVNFSDNKLTGIDVLAKSLQELKTVDVSGNEITTLAPLTGAAALKKLNVSNNGITSLEPIASAVSLTQLDASDNQLTDVSCLSGCAGLTDVDLSCNEIEKMDSLCFGEGVSVSLNVCHNRIKTVVLPGAKYKYLALYGNPISDFTALYQAQGDTVVLDYSGEIDFSSLGGADFKTYCIFDCPLDQQVSVKNALGTYNVRLTTEEEYRSGS